MVSFKLRNKNRLNSRGFSLLEVLVALGLLCGVGLIAAKILDMIQLNSKASARKEAQFQMQVRGVKLLKLQLKGLKKNQFDLELFYKLGNGNTLSRNSTQLNGQALLSHITDPIAPLPTSVGPYLTSFLVRRKLGDRYLTYISTCLPLSNMLNINSLNYNTLQKNNLWPFIRSTTNGYSVHCCPRSNSMCTNPVFNKNSNYGVQIFRFDPKDNSIRSILTKRDFESVSSMGYFIFSNQSNENILSGRVFTFYNECISQRIVTGTAKQGCQDFLSVRSAQLAEDFDYAVEGVNSMGGSIGL